MSEYTIRSCKYLIQWLTDKKSLPRGETSESVGEHLATHRRVLKDTKQFSGKTKLMLELDDLQKKYPDPAELLL